MSDAPRIRYAYTPLKYAIAVAGGRSLRVDGYAVRMPPPFHRLRLCVRFDQSRWVVDHFDSGYAWQFSNVADVLASPNKATPNWDGAPCLDNTTRGALVESLYKALHFYHANGRLRRLLEEAGYGWCLDEAGL